MVSKGKDHPFISIPTSSSPLFHSSLTFCLKCVCDPAHLCPVACLHPLCDPPLGKRTPRSIKAQLKVSFLVVLVISCPSCVFQSWFMFLTLEAVLMGSAPTTAGAPPSHAAIVWRLTRTSFPPAHRHRGLPVYMPLSSRAGSALPPSVKYDHLLPPFLSMAASVPLAPAVQATPPPHFE